MFIINSGFTEKKSIINTKQRNPFRKFPMNLKTNQENLESTISSTRKQKNAK